MVNSANFRLRGHIYSHNINKCHVMKKCHVTITSVSWGSIRIAAIFVYTWLRSRPRGVNKGHAMWTMPCDYNDFKFRVSAHSRHIWHKGHWPWQTRCLFTSEKTLSQCNKYLGLSWDRARASKTHNNLKFHCREKLHISHDYPWYLELFTDFFSCLR
jgi:hypothetical protein